MDLSNTSFIVSTAQGNIVVNPQSTLSYKDVTFVGNGFYDWGHILAQNLAFIADEIANLKDGGVQQATFDANQFIAQFQASQTQALTDHTNNLLLAIDNKIATKFAVVNSDLTTSLATINTHFTTLENAYIAADTALNLSIRNDLNLVIDTKVNLVQSNLEAHNIAYGIFHDDLVLWRSTVSPLIDSFSSSFELFKTNTNDSILAINTNISENYNDLDNKITVINNNVAGNNATVLANANLYTDGKASVLTAMITAVESNANNTLLDHESRLGIAEDAIVVINNELPTLASSTELEAGVVQAKTYADTKVNALTAPTGVITVLQNAVNQLNVNFDSSVHAVVDPLIDDITGVGGSLTVLNSTVTNYMNTTNGVISTNNNDMLSRFGNLDGRVQTIENTYPINANNYTDSKIILVNDDISSLTGRVTLTETDIDTINTTLSTLSTTSSTAEAGVSDLTPRVAALETSRATTTAMVAADTATLTSAKTYTDGKVTLLTTGYTTADTATLTSAKTYTDGKVAILTSSKANQTQVDAIDTLVGIIDSWKLSMIDTVVPDMAANISALQTANTNLNTDLSNLVDSKTASIASYLDSSITYIKENYVTFDSIYPIMKKVIGYVINNQITAAESDDLFNNIISMYKDSLTEAQSTLINTNIFVTATNYNIRLVLNKQQFQNGITSIQFYDGTTSKTINSFVSNTDASIITNFQNTSLLLANGGDVLNYAVQFDSTLNLANIVANISYLNEFGFSSNIQYKINDLINQTNTIPYIFSLRDLKVESTHLILYVNSFILSSDVLVISEILGDGDIIDPGLYTVSGTTSFDGYSSKLIRIDLGSKDLYLNGPLETGGTNLVNVNFTKNGIPFTNTFDIQSSLNYSVGGTN